MATLTGNPIKDSYDGLIKTTDNAALGAVEKEITDGTGVSSTLKLGTTSASFVGTLDLTGATVTGLPPGGVSSIIAGTGISVDTATGDVTVTNTGGAGLVNGTGTDSLVSAAALTTTAAVAGGNLGIALGNGASANGSEAIAIGDQAYAGFTGSAAIGQYAEASATYASAWGRTSYARADGSVAFGQQAGVPSGTQYAGAVAMGRQVTAINGDTTHVRALYIVAPDGGTGGNGITMLSPNGTAYTLTVSDAGALVIS